MVFNFIDFTPLSYGDYQLPDWAQALGWLMAVASVAMIPVFAVIKIVQSYKDPDYSGKSFVQVSGAVNTYHTFVKPS